MNYLSPKPYNHTLRTLWENALQVIVYVGGKNPTPQKKESNLW
jgi:hypothetical protein